MACNLRKGKGTASKSMIFRAHSKNERLYSSFDEVCEIGKVRANKRGDIEAKMLRAFKRAIHHYREEAIPQEDDFLEWLSLGRHYGMPSRLADFTYSFYVAAYFAINRASADRLIWAVDSKRLIKMTDRKLRLLVKEISPSRSSRSPKSHTSPSLHDPLLFHAFGFSHAMRKPAEAFVAPVSPFRRNMRLIQQQGLFLFGTDVRKSLEDNLKAMCKKYHIRVRDIVKKIYVRVSNKRRILNELRRMNINCATLFPDLGSFADSLKDEIYYRTPVMRSEIMKAIQYPNTKNSAGSAEKES